MIFSVFSILPNYSLSSWRFFGVLFFCSSQSKSFSRTKAEPRSKQKTMGEEQWGLFSLPSPLDPSPIVFVFVCGSAFAQLNLLLYDPHKKKHAKKLPATRLIKLIIGRCHNIYRLGFLSVTNLLNTSVVNLTVLYHLLHTCGKSKILVVSKLISCTTRRKVNETKKE